MAAAQNDIIRVIVNQRQAGQVIQNVYFYRVVTLTGLADDYLSLVADWMVNEVFPPIRNIQAAQLTYENINITNVTNGIDFYDRVFSPALAGLSPGDAMPPNVTYTFRLLRETLATRHGYKRFAGVDETLQSNGLYIGSENATGAIQEALAADIQPAPSIIPLLEPVIVRKDAAGAISAVNSVGASDFRGIGTQNTRKIGRGS